MAKDRTIGSVFKITAVKGVGLLLTLALTALQAAAFGTSAAADAFFFARQTLSSANSMLEGWIKKIMVPVFLASAAREPAAMRRGLWRLALTWGGGAALLAGLAVLGAPWLVEALAPGFDGARLELAVLVFRILAAGLPLTLVAALFAALHYARRRFGLATFATLMPRLAALAGFAVAGLGLSVAGLAWWLVGGMAAMAAITGYTAWRALARVAEDAQAAPAAPRTGRRGLVVTAMLLGQLLLGWANAALATMGAAGTVALMFLGLRLLNAGPGMTNTAVNTVYYTEYARGAGGAQTEQARRIAAGIRMSMFFVFPVAGLLAWGAHPLIALVMERGAFSAADTAAMAVFVQLMIPSLAINAVYGSLAAALTADMTLPALRTAVVAGVLAVATRLGVGLPLMGSLGLTALALAILTSSAVSLVVHYLPLRRAYGRLMNAADALAMLRAALAAGLGALAAWLLPEAPLVLRLAVYGAVFVLAAQLLHVPEMRYLGDRLQPLLRRGRRAGA
jgi:putative peptidoglycan lipid II flippase